MKHLAINFGSNDGGCYGNDSLGCRYVGVVWGPTVSVVILREQLLGSSGPDTDYRVHTGLGKLQTG